MSRTIGLTLAAMAVGCVAILMAAESTPKEFQDIMLSNGAIVDITLGIEAVSPNEQSADAHKPTSLRAHVRAKDYDGIASDAATLKANFAKVEAFWKERDVEDAVNFSKASITAANNLEAAAKAKDNAKISESVTAIIGTCRSCHQSHRVMQLPDKRFRIM